jgi:hypothetical protein
VPGVLVTRPNHHCLYKLFQTADRDGNGAIDLEEAKPLFRVANLDKVWLQITFFL